ncbi:hypothetical protein CWC09_17155 [Pseudoalteromonas ruthenica]|uniref:Uncharacterized protein n=1 Tax=Pseudoalteromonas ruthenica TaxID=151081 RepID=A0A0F4PM22_9GAMM|nr:hypothetical protein TW76_12770 [Pseudoalteromonas ruthenica]KJY96801.1 hypothetical protein TW72_16440 [Pseudoalteromonas ruthenica]TMO91457.1 hypothetical protein CWC13_15130 [Pseudoalteromonas ruthenica]TMP01557.1 hypothetical protein CWC07_01005 [Pseudoalteromonas ruthenica]TMP03859.1 hypothetical protein CWC09_17155 [Pseudoalteromonas ruthenica]
MEIEDLISILQSGNEREISDISYSLMNVSDNAFLQKLAGSLELITPLSSSSYWSSHGNKHRVRVSIDRITTFLEAVRTTGCRCAKYLQLPYFANSEADKGMIEIILNEADPQTRKSKITCQCTACAQYYVAHEFDAGFGRRAQWEKLAKL